MGSQGLEKHAELNIRSGPGHLSTGGNKLLGPLYVPTGLKDSLEMHPAASNLSPWEGGCVPGHSLAQKAVLQRRLDLGWNFLRSPH